MFPVDQVDLLAVPASFGSGGPGWSGEGARRDEVPARHTPQIEFADEPGDGAPNDSRGSVTAYFDVHPCRAGVVAGLVEVEIDVVVDMV
jgi:hypothetical protein